MDNLKEKSVKGIIWSAIDNFSRQGIQLVITLVIARMLMPSDYGLIAMVWIFVDISNKIVDSGFSNALIQKKNRNQSDFSTVFYFNVVVGVVIYLIILFAAPFIASFYNVPELSLILKILPLVVIFNSLGVVQKTILIINLDFKRLAKISVISVLISGTMAIYMAYDGCGVWTLVTQQIIVSLITLTLLWYTSSWHPFLTFSTKSFRLLFGFGSKLMIGAIIHSLYTNLYSLIIGKVFNASQLGLFNRANSIAQLPADNITTVFERVSYPIECELQDDNERLCVAFFKFIRMASFILFPIMMCLVSIATPLVKLVLTDKWLPCVPFLQLICIANMFLPIMRMNWNLLNAKHRSDYSLKAEIIKKIVAFSILFATFRFGVFYMCIGMIAYSIADWFIITRYTRKVVHQVTMGRQVVVLAPIMFMGVISSVAGYSVQVFLTNVWLQLFGGTIVFVTIYLLLSKMMNRNEYQEIIQLKNRK